MKETVNDMYYTLRIHTHTHMHRRSTGACRPLYRNHTVRKLNGFSLVQMQILKK